MSAASPKPESASFGLWRAPLGRDWLERCAALNESLRQAQTGSGAALPADFEIALRTLASEQVGLREQVKLEALARRALASLAPLGAFQRFRLGVISNHTLAFLKDALAAAGLARGLLIEFVEAPYDHVAAFAYGEANPFADIKLDALLVVLYETAFPRNAGLLDESAEAADVEAAAALIEQLAEAGRRKCRAPLILATLPENTVRIASAELATAGAGPRLSSKINQAMIAGAQRRRWILWDQAGLAARIGGREWFDPVQFFVAKAPFRIGLRAVVADHLSSLVAAMTGRSGRAIVLDLDNTLWGGVVADDGLAGLRLGQNSAEGEAYVAFQRFVLELRRRGVVIAVCSKNSDEIAREPFRSHPEMVLREEHIAVFQASWEDKATSLQAIAGSLKLGLESLVFVDDNPAERFRVRQELPLVKVPEIGDDPAEFASRICDSGVFEHLQLNADDLGRARSYGDGARRAAVSSKVGHYDDYLKSLQMRMTVSRFDEIGRARIVQLINKSNQFNLTTRRYNEEDVRALESDPHALCWQIRLDDAFAAHGMVGVVILRLAPAAWTIDTWLQSCRVLERGVEETVMNLVMQRARAAGVQKVQGAYLPTARNGLVADFYERLGFARQPDEPSGGARAYWVAPEDFKLLKSFIELDSNSA